MQREGEGEQAVVTGYFPCDHGTYQQSQVLVLLQLGRWPIQTALQIIIAMKLPDVGWSTLLPHS